MLGKHKPQGVKSRTTNAGLPNLVLEEMASAELTELARLVSAAHRNESAAAAVRGEPVPWQLSVHGLQLGDTAAKPTVRPPISRFELLDSWRTLVQKLAETSVCLDHVPALTKAFQTMDDIGEYRHVKTLIDLLTQAADKCHQETSVECRFVTLLEIMLSYGPDWTQPSDPVALWWTRLSQEPMPSGIAPISFRRKAYRVLVSLTWVPSSLGLLEACSFDAQKQVIDFTRATTVRQHIMAIRVRQPRYDLVNQLLDRLKDETDVCVAIASEKEGMGKTTLAAHVASHPAIRHGFAVLWLTVATPNPISTTTSTTASCGTGLTYDIYTEYLDQLCEQAHVQPKIQWPHVVKRLEEPALRKLREQEFMLQAKMIMAQLLVEKDSNILLVLDNVRDASLVEWFRFSERQSIVVTTPDASLAGVDWTVGLECMSEEEAVELFLLEACLPKDHILGATVECRSILKRCEYNPLIVRSIARYFHLMQVTAGPVRAIVEILEALDSLVETTTEDDDDPNMLLFDVLSFLIGPTRKSLKASSVLFVMTFAALVIVFPDRAPLGEVLLLWEEILKLEPHALEELSEDGIRPSDATLKRHVWFIAEGLVHMGLIAVADDEQGNPWVHVHHHLYKEFAVLMAAEITSKASFEETIIEWNKAFVSAYFSQRLQDESGTSVDDNSWEYAIENLPSHMLKGKMLAAAESVLTEGNFFKARIQALGWKRAMKLHVSDCVNLQRAMAEQEEGSYSCVSSVFKQTAEMVKARAVEFLGSIVENVNVERARLLSDLGFALAEIGYFSEGLELFGEAQSFLQESDPLFGSVLYGAAWAHLHANETKKALQMIKACRSVMDRGSDQHALYKDVLQLVGSALVAECEYREALEFYELVCEKMKKEVDGNRVELGCTLHGKARLHHTMGELGRAEEVYIECLAWKQGMGEKSRSLALVHSSLGDLYMAQNQVHQAKSQYGTALDILKELSCNTDDLEYQLLTGKFLSLRGDYHGSSKAFELVQDGIGKRPTLVFDKAAFDLRCISRSYVARGNLEKAVELLQESLVLTLSRPYSLERASGLTDLGNCLLDMDNHSGGLAYLEKAMEIEIIKLGESTKVLDSLKAIGNVHLSLAAYDDALCTRSLTVSMVDKRKDLLKPCMRLATYMRQRKTTNKPLTTLSCAHKY
jgi:tetratricopeptide (TPR) repeat protein